jgi:hypothetical protein
MKEEEAEGKMTMILKKENKKNKGGAVEGMVLEVKYDIS